MHGLHRSADVHVHVFVLSQFADIVAIFPETHDGEAARIVGCLRGANIEESCSIGQFHHVKDMGADADIFVDELGCLVGGNARLGAACVGRHGCDKTEQHESAQTAQGHRKSFWGISARVTRMGAEGKRDKATREFDSSFPTLSAERSGKNGARGLFSDDRQLKHYFSGRLLILRSWRRGRSGFLRSGQESL